MSIAFQRKLFTVDDFAGMIKAGILREGERVELIDGEIREMSAIGPLHASIVNRLNRILTKQLGDRAIVSVQNPVILNDFTEPQPDLVVLRENESFYKDSLPRPSDVLLVIEVSDSSIDYDRDDKLPRYAKMRIPEVWIVDVHGQEVVQYARPNAGKYQHEVPFQRGEELTALDIESLRLSVDELFQIGR